MSRFVSRRSLVQAGAAMLGAVSVQVATATVASALPAPASPDAALMALIDRHIVVTGEWNVLGKQWDELFDRWQEEKPERPAALDARFAEGLGVYPVKGLRSDGTLGLIYDEVEVEQMRTTTPHPKWIGSSEPCPVAVARRAEILTVHDTWRAECDALTDRLGLPEAEAKANAAYFAVERLETEIMAFRPSTLTGFVLKAKWIQKEQSAAPLADQLVADLCAHGHSS